MGRRELVANLAFRTGLLSPWFKRREGSLLILNYHRIGPEKHPVEFDPDVYTCDAEAFRKICQWLSRNSSVLSESDLLWHLTTGRPFRSRSVLLTFDDGYIDNFTLALPILREFHLPAIFFIPTDALDQRSLGWWDLISFLINNTRLKRIVLNSENIEVPSDRSTLIREFLERMKRLPHETTQGMVEKLSEACQVALPPVARQSAELMSWEQVRQLPLCSVAVGAHTRSHRVLATLSLEEQFRELSESKSILEKRIGRPVRTLAYPVGGYEHFHQETMILAKKSGYRAAFSFCTGWNQKTIENPFDLRRVSAPATISETAGMLHWPSVFARRQCATEAPSPFTSSPHPLLEDWSAAS